jgi:histidyl-tRNA synthetase
MPAPAEFRAPKGTRDILAPESSRWDALVDCFARQVRRAGYGLALTPLFEEVGLFSRGVGETSDIVTKEMYDFTDKAGRHIALRPEFTASLVRAFIQHRPQVPWKTWYWGPGFRYEKPQAGRYRQFFQLGIEVIGSADPQVDVEVVTVATDFLASLGLSRVTLLINSLGDGRCRPAYRTLLTDFLTAHDAELCDEHKGRWQTNPLRVLDCKRSTCRQAIAEAPMQLDHLCEECQAHWSSVTEGLSGLGIAFTIAPRLVRGLDYYTRTTFEFAADSLDRAQNAVGGGGRYDGLVEELGGPSTPGIGFSIGIDRTLLACDAEGVFPATETQLDAFVVDVTDGRQATVICHQLRRAGLRADRTFDARSMKAQMKMADRSGAAVAVIVGEDEAAEESATVRPLRGGGDQLRVLRSDLVSAVEKLVGAIQS